MGIGGIGGIGSMKARRQSLILELIEREPLHSQEELRRRLRAQGIEATQATISRDVKELRLVKGAGEGGYQRSPRETSSPLPVLDALERAAAEFLRGADCVRQLVVLRTGPGQAQPLAAAIDRARLPGALGTIAGDDTILVIAKDGRRAAAVARRLTGYAQR